MIAVFRASAENAGHNVAVINVCRRNIRGCLACEECGLTYKSDYTDALGHDYVPEVTEPTCTEQGYTTYTCSR